MSEVKKELAEASYQRVVDVLDAARKDRDLLHGPAWARTILAKSFESYPVAAWTIFASFFMMKGAGAHDNMLKVAFRLGFSLVLLGLLVVLVAGAVCGFAWLRAKRPRRTSARSIAEDCVWMERLSSCSKHAVKCVHHAKAARHERSRDGQKFTLGAAGKISPFAILLVLLFISQADTLAMIKQGAPALVPFISNPLNAYGAMLIAAAVAYARLQAYAKDASLSTDLMLLAGALECIEANEKLSAVSDAHASARLTEGTPASEAGLAPKSVMASPGSAPAAS